EVALATSTRPTPARATALIGLARLLTSWAEPERRSAYILDGLAVYEAIGDPRGIAQGLRALHFALDAKGDTDGARNALERSLTVYVQLGDRRGVAETLSLMGRLAVEHEAPAEAGELLERSLSIADEMDDPFVSLGPLNNLGLAAYARGDYPEA